MRALGTVQEDSNQYVHGRIYSVSGNHKENSTSGIYLLDKISVNLESYEVLNLHCSDKVYSDVRR